MSNTLKLSVDGRGQVLGSGQAAALGRGDGSAGPGDFQDVGCRHSALRFAESGGGAMDGESLNAWATDRPDKGVGECADQISGFQTRSNPRFSKSFTFAVAKRVTP